MHLRRDWWPLKSTNTGSADSILGKAPHCHMTKLRGADFLPWLGVAN